MRDCASCMVLTQMLLRMRTTALLVCCRGPVRGLSGTCREPVGSLLGASPLLGALLEVALGSSWALAVRQLTRDQPGAGRQLPSTTSSRATGIFHRGRCFSVLRTILLTRRMPASPPPLGILQCSSLTATFPPISGSTSGPYSWPMAGRSLTAPGTLGGFAEGTWWLGSLSTQTQPFGWHSMALCCQSQGYLS